MGYNIHYLQATLGEPLPFPARVAPPVRPRLEQPLQPPPPAHPAIDAVQQAAADQPAAVVPRLVPPATPAPDKMLKNHAEAREFSDGKSSVGFYRKFFVPVESCTVVPDGSS